MTTKAEIVSIISGEVNQGTRLDSAIPTYLRRAFRFIERNYNFLYMERFGEVDLDIDSANPRFLSWPSTRTKKVNFIRYAQSAAGTNQQRYVYLNSVDPTTSNTIEPESLPSAYWLTGDADGTVYAVLDQVGTEDRTFELHYVEFSEFPGNDSDEHWLFENAEDVLVAQTMRLIAPYANEPDWLKFYEPQWEEGIRTLTRVDEEARASGPPDGFKMVFR